MALGGATSLLLIVLCAPATSTRVVRLRVAEAAVVAAGSDRTVAIAATMALGGAISLLRIVLRVQAASTRVLRLRAVDDRARSTSYRMGVRRQSLCRLACVFCTPIKIRFSGIGRWIVKS